MSDRDRIVDGTRLLLKSLSPWLSEVSVLAWEETQGFFPVIRRSILIRQFEALNVAVDLVETNRGYAAVLLLRSACEELLWLRYFQSLSDRDARLLADSFIETGLLNDLEAQAGEVGEKEMEGMGLLPLLSGFRKRKPESRAKIRELGKRLGWPPRTTNKGEMPSAWFIARTTGSKALYRFLYHATSRYVHFNPVELARRGWGHPGRLEISSATYEPVWATFSLAWGTRLFGWIVEASLAALQAEGVSDPDFEALNAAFKLITDVPLMPLVTQDETHWHPNVTGKITRV